MHLALLLSIRLLIAGVLGAIIGYERELRSKGAGIRTHVLVALGSALFMIISQYGFENAARFDAARVAAGVVGGLGFLGGGIIMKNKRVNGLTTAAGLWVTGAIGLSAGCGLFELSALCAFFVLLCMEALHFYTFKLGDKEVRVVFTAKDQAALVKTAQALGKQVADFALFKQSEGYKSEMLLRIKKKESTVDLLSRLQELPDVVLESLE